MKEEETYEFYREQTLLLTEEYKNLQQRIDKAVEYIKENKNEGIDDDGYSDAYYDWIYINELLDILEGRDKE